MSQLVSKTSNESNGVWLPIIEYSVKTGVSLSTIRRKIKSNGIQYRLDKGRYLILYNGMNDHVSTTAPVAAPAIPNDIHRWQDQPLSNLSSKFREMNASFAAPEPTPVRAVQTAEITDEAVEKAVAMVSDAFEHAITEKEARIRLLEKSNRQLEDRVAELKLLIRVLEEKFNVRY